MKTNNKDSKFELGWKTDKIVIPRGKECIRILEVSITAPVVEQKRLQPPLNLSLVLDRSGSMAGEKLQYAKQAAVHLIDLLEAKDHVAVTVYDDVVDVISPSREMTDANKKLAKTEVQRISSRGSTNLFGGWLKGCEQVAETEIPDCLNRTLLMSDGLANVGISNIDELATHSRELFQRGVSTSCFGIGTDYNEHLLEAMSNAGGGNFHFLEAMSAIPLSFEREFEELINISLRNVEVMLELPQGVGCELSAGWPSIQNGQVFTVSVGSLYSGRQLKLYFQLHIPAISDAETLLLPVIAKAKTAEDSNAQNDQSISFTFVDAEAEVKTTCDPELMERFALVDMADRATEALKLARAGNRTGANDLLYQTVNRHRKNMPAAMQQKYDYMSQEIKEGMNEMSFKRHHQEEYENKRMRLIVRDYSLSLVNGHLFTNIENNRVLIDTGIPASLSSQTKWHFMHEVHPMSTSYLGVSLDQISHFVGASIDILLGTDIMKNLCVLFELDLKRVSFSTRPLHQFPQQFPLSLIMGVPGVEIDVNGETCEMFLDTGAKLSYLSKTFTDNLKSIGVEKDFYPGLGEFETPVYEAALKLGGNEFTLRCGVLPQLLESSLLISGKKGIIGAEFFNKFQVQLDFPQKMMGLRV